MDKNKMPDPMYQNPDNWKWGFYVNSKDPRLIVPKINPEFGWTLNCGHKSTVLGVVLTVLIIVAYTVFV